VEGDERRRADRWSSDAEIEILSPVQQIASAVDVSRTGMQISLDEWLSAGTVCDLRITTHTGRTILKRARVVWTRREGERCVSGLEVVGSIAPHTPDDD
jgi:phenylpropionate dioxygenase-like ring-hydroxylating dioxygenase large terminal subunit